MGNFLADLRPERLPAHQKKEANDWYAVFNPQVPRVLDVDLVHTLLHDSVVCCVRFSLDGKYVATGCNRAAQIFDVETGNKVSYLEDATVDKEGDLYIRSVCFSPDGRYLATGAEDKQIRVRSSSSFFVVVVVTVVVFFFFFLLRSGALLPRSFPPIFIAGGDGSIPVLFSTEPTEIP